MDWMLDQTFQQQSCSEARLVSLLSRRQKADLHKEQPRHLGGQIRPQQRVRTPSDRCGTHQGLPPWQCRWVSPTLRQPPLLQSLHFTGDVGQFRAA